jgi:hypothetical protein
MCGGANLPVVTINLKNIWTALPPKGDITNILNESGMSEAKIRRAIAARLEDDRKLIRVKTLLPVEYECMFFV